MIALQQNEPCPTASPETRTFRIMGCAELTASSSESVSWNSLAVFSMMGTTSSSKYPCPTMPLIISMWEICGANGHGMG